MENNNNYLDLLIDLIINNATLSYSKDELRINNDDTIMQVLKVIAKDKYENRLEDLLNIEEKKSKVILPLDNITLSK